MTRKFTPVFLVALATCAIAMPAIQEKVELQSRLLNKLGSGESANLVVEFKSGVSRLYDQISSKSFRNAAQRMTTFRTMLIEETSKSQRAITKLLENEGVSFQSFWITNKIIVPKANFALAKTLASHPDVAFIREEVVAQLAPVTQNSEVTIEESRQQNPVVGVNLVGAPNLWARNITGEGIVVANIDTGIRPTHRILRDNYIGEYGWYDPFGRSSVAYDDQGHGTHTIGTIAGKEGYGVAPSAKFMACKGCRQSGWDYPCFEADLLACAQFMACPTLTDGSRPDCSKAPDVVSNSWGGSGGRDFYDDAIRAMQLAGSIVVFAAGNDGTFGCRYLGSPGDRDIAIGVAATDDNDRIASFSSRGPTLDGRIKPEISAPGVNVLSAAIGNDNSFRSSNGTSMACPHVAGGIALLLQSNPSLKGNQTAVKNVLAQGAVKSGLIGSNQNCGGISESVFPNNLFGHGRLNVAASSQIN